MATKRRIDTSADAGSVEGSRRNTMTDDESVSDPLSGQSSEAILRQIKPVISFNELSFLPLDSQSNIYGLAQLQYNDKTILLVSTIRDGIFQVHYDPASLRLSWKQIEFSYIPGDVDIISMDTFTRGTSSAIVGVTLIKRESEPKEIYFNIYGHRSPTISHEPFRWDNITEDWQAINLKFVPFQLTHTNILVDKEWEKVFLLSGDDLQVHLYKLQLLSDEWGFQEDPCVVTIFPDLQELPSSVMYMNIVVMEGKLQRISAFGCQNGYIRCCLVDMARNDILYKIDNSSIDGPVSSIQLIPAGSDDFHLLSTSAVQSGLAFTNILADANSINQPILLPQSDQYDSVMCSALANITWKDSDGEILLGTYGKKLLLYQLSERGIGRGHYDCELLWSRWFAHGIHGVWYGDVTGDGLNELVVLTAGGVHILQHDMNCAIGHLVSLYTD